jgi:hypothetical protein
MRQLAQSLARYKVFPSLAHRVWHLLTPWHDKGVLIGIIAAIAISIFHSAIWEVARHYLIKLWTFIQPHLFGIG